MSLATMVPLFRNALSGLGLPATAISMGGAVREFSSAAPSDLKSTVAALIPEQQERLKTLKKLHGAKGLGTVTVEQTVGGMRGIPAMLWETSLLDADEGIRFRGYSIPELQVKLPRVKEEPIPEGILWLLLTGQVPTAAQAASVTEDLRSRAKLPPHVIKVLDALPPDAHPMTQFATGVMAMQNKSKFMNAYNKGINKRQYWDPIYEDSMDLIANLPELAAAVYRRTYHGGKYIPADPTLDWAANLSHMMGYDGDEVYELFRLYQTIHSDHEGGNVSAHACHLVGSALSDPYLSFTAAMNGLAGPLHGLANQEVLFWLENMTKSIGENPSKSEVEKYCRDTLAKGQVVPGYGHAVLRKTDPRYTVQREFALKHLPNDPGFKLVSHLFDVVPGVLAATGKVKNPWPNVDAHSGVLLKYYGIKEASFYTVLFGVSRALGVLSQGVWSRALGLPIERPKSLTSAAVFARFD